MQQGVTQAKPDRWYMSIDEKVMGGYRFRYRLVLECGHEVWWASPAQPSRDVANPPPHPWRANCKECDR